MSGDSPARDLSRGGQALAHNAEAFGSNANVRYFGGACLSMQ
jgi:hypothetical protein